ncbi:hypothetical protein MPDQ_007817 [Monascus purpureus]|uniref:Uncharacterized protein n=1 Tax=Monascus purpureus TaxID=5098 RepID=A0A507QR81_MONPU|nr:hypothetical protein MPDQ_007817 [Monascus purpureus]
MNHLPPELLCHILEDIGATFVEKYLDGTEEARDVLDGRLSVVGAITRALSLDTSIKNGCAFSIRQIAAEIEEQFMCYNNLVCYQRSGYIYVYNNARRAEDYAIDIQHIETLVASAEQVSQPTTEEDHPVLLRHFKYHKIAVVLYSVRCIACIELGENASWQVIYTRQFSAERFYPDCMIATASIWYANFQGPSVDFEWSDLEGSEKHSLTRHLGDRLYRFDMVPSGSNIHIGLALEDCHEHGMIALANGRLIYKRIQKYLAPFWMYSDEKGGVTLLTPTQVDNQLVLFPPDGKPGFHQLSRAFFELGNNTRVHSLFYDNFITLEEISSAIILNKSGIVFSMEERRTGRGHPLFLANFDARSEYWTSLHSRQIGRFTVTV